MQDSVLELWLRLLALHIEDPEEGSVGRKIGMVGCSRHADMALVVFMSDSMKQVETEEGRKIVSSAIESLMIALENGPDKLNYEGCQHS